MNKPIVLILVFIAIFFMVRRRRHEGFGFGFSTGLKGSWINSCEEKIHDSKNKILTARCKSSRYGRPISTTINYGMCFNSSVQNKDGRGTLQCGF